MPVPHARHGRVAEASVGQARGNITGVAVAETFNTAIESLARAVDTQFHPRLRDALDIASAAVLLASGTAVMIGLCVFVPALYRLFCSVL